MREQRYAARTTGRSAGAGAARRRTGRSTRLAAVAAVGLTAVLLSGCGEEGSKAAAPTKVAGEAAPVPGDSPGTASHKKSTSPSSSENSREGGTKNGDKPSTSSKGDGGGSSSGSGGSGPGSGPGSTGSGSCKTSDLAFSTSHGMGEGSLLVNLRNTGSTACTLQGFPGVTLQSDAGTLNPARRNEAAPRVSVAPGEETRFTLNYLPNDTGGSGVHVTSLVVTPPDETQSRTLPVQLNLPVSDQPTPEVSVSPVGAGK
ncbi:MULTISPECIES: DUF4232 domain-containing protein [Streptomyces]|uniref:DUF4232 domain-containing protein n=1 Tax=Streptomyces TaxID=1883 RepID=UPI001CEDC54F|nr:MULTISPECIES: DUF4232 domain-containing protein [Streptomyces]MDI6410239.1 DUF4232 domain-containing protein [Streptomyces albus]